MRNFVMTSESVTQGHPDKLCDRISDAVVDAYLATGARAGVIAECAIATGVVFLSVRSGIEAPVDLADLARRVLSEAGYEEATREGGPTIMLDLSHAPDLAPERLAEGRARHMVSAFGYACDQTDTAMPYPIWAAHRMAAALDAARCSGALPWLSPDAQAQIAVRFEGRRPVAIEALALTFGHVAHVDAATAREALGEAVIGPALAGGMLAIDGNTRIVTLPATGAAGPEAHSGLTGRKSADDAYGSYIRRGGPALSGKDPARIDRIANYAARQAARAAVAAGLAAECEVQLSYVVGDEAPVSVEVDTYGTGRQDDARLSPRLAELFDFRVGAIAERMGLWDLPAARGGRFYRDLASYGQMGRDDLAAPWEDISAAEAL